MIPFVKNKCSKILCQTRKTLDNIINLRNKVEKDAIKCQDQAINNLFSLAEAYPDLKSS